MNNSKGQQSFSSYSQEDFNEPYPSEEDKFSEYEEQKGKLDRSGKLKEPQTILGQKRRYSYGPTSFTSTIHNLRNFKYTKGVGSPCGIGAFDSSALEEYEKCYLSGLSKYYKSHNYIAKRQAQPALSATSSIEKSKNLDRSEYWNGQKFAYLAEKQMVPFSQQVKERKRSESNNNQQRKRSESYNIYQRNVNSGLIVNKRQMKENRQNEQVKASGKDSSQYIRIEEDLSNSKNCSEMKKQTRNQNNISARIISDPLTELFLKPNVPIQQKRQQSDTQFQSIRLNSNPFSSSHLQKDFAALLNEKNLLIQQNASLHQTITHKNAEIQRLAKQRIKDNDDYTQKIDKLKVLFESQRVSLLKQHEQQLSIYKQIRKQAIKNQLVKEEEERLNLITQKNRTQNQLKRVISQLSCVKEQLNTKMNKLRTLQKKVSFLENQGHSQNNNLSKDQGKKQGKQANIQLQNKNRKEGQSVPKEKDIQEWKSNFVNVFKNMVRKLIGQTDKKWSDKKLVIIGWKIIKIMIEKGVKLGIKVPQVIYEDQIGECSIIGQPRIHTDQSKKDNLNGSQKPIRS